MIECKKVILRHIDESDLDEMYRLSSNVLQRGEFFSIRTESKWALQNRFKKDGFWNQDQGTLLVTDKKQRMLGTISFFKGLPYAQGFELGAVIYRPEDRGQGYMTEAIRVFCSYLFDLMDIPRLQANTSRGNAASRRLLEKCGFVFEGTMRNALFHRGAYTDVLLFSLLREECSSFSEVMGLSWSFKPGSD